jgi:DNA-binding MarR family transcriptional regulator
MSTSSPQPKVTDKQGQDLAFIHTYALVNGKPPAEADMQRFFGVTPPTVHRMVVELEERGLIRRLPRQSRSIEVTLDPTELPGTRAVQEIRAIDDADGPSRRRRPAPCGCPSAL